MTRTPSAKEWERYAELQRQGVPVDEDDLDFVLGVIRRYDPAKNDSLIAFYRWCSARSKSCFRKDFLPQVAGNENAVYDSKDTSPVDAAEDAATVRESVGQAGYAVLRLRYGEGLSVSQTAKRLGLSRESVAWVEKEALTRASSLAVDD